MTTVPEREMAKGKGPKGLDWSGIYPATVIPFKDKTCREVDEEAWRILLRDILEADITGIDPNEVEGLSREETIRLIKIAKEETKGRIPVSGKVEARCAEWTWDLVEEAKPVVDAGADFLYLHPRPEFDNFEDFVNLYKSFDKAVGVPFITLLAPSVGISAGVMKRIALECENLVGYKIRARYNIWDMKEVVHNLREAEAETGRHVCPLLAGDHGLVECLINGAEGNFNGGGSWRAREDVAIYQAVVNGDYNKAFAIQKRLEPVTDAVRGMYGARIMSAGSHPLRYKIVCWLLGKIPNPYARLPRVPLIEEALMLREALIKSGLKVVREAKEVRELEASEY